MRQIPSDTFAALLIKRNRLGRPFPRTDEADVNLSFVPTCAERARAIKRNTNFGVFVNVPTVKHHMRFLKPF
jgi:hypothetical protein